MNDADYPTPEAPAPFAPKVEDPKTLEQQLRRQQRVRGIPVQLADGEFWTVGPRPLVGRLAEQIDEALLDLTDATSDYVEVQNKYDAQKEAREKKEPAPPEGWLTPRERLEAELCFIRAGFQAAFLGLRINYPALTEEQGAELISEENVTKVARAVRGVGHSSDEALAGIDSQGNE